MSGLKRIGTLFLALVLSLPVMGTELADIQLPAPRMTGGKPLMEALAARQSLRAFSPRELPAQVLADLLWAAAGINRPDSGRRTAPTARNWQEIEIYVVVEAGVYRYDPAANRLVAVMSGDLRGLTGTQAFAATAPLNLVFIADTTKMRGASPEDQAFYMAADTGFISQNVYLFCASEGLATVVRGLVDRPALAAALKLPEHKKIVLAQTIGYPAEAER